jgi:hypothetical protein
MPRFYLVIRLDTGYSRAKEILTLFPYSQTRNVPRHISHSLDRDVSEYIWVCVTVERMSLIRRLA